LIKIILNMKLYYGTSNPVLSKKIIDRMQKFYDSEGETKFNGIDSGRLSIEQFADGEILPRFMDSIRGEDIFFIQTTNTSDSLVETLLVIDAAKRAGCRSFTLIAPFQGYSRQDKTDHIRSSIGSKMISDVLEKVGMTRLITIDLHASSIQGFYNTSVIHLNGNNIFIKYIKSLELDNLVICSPDYGGTKKNTDFAKSFPGSNFAIMMKKRIKPNEVHSMQLIGDVDGKNVVIVDDMADTLGTLVKATEVLFQNGALSVRCVATHAILSRTDAMDILNNSMITELVVSDTIGSVYKHESPKLKVISCSKLIVDVVDRLVKNESTHELTNAI
jgi:ribose-phosphate pyrophosphokinase